VAQPKIGTLYYVSTSGDGSPVSRWRGGGALPESLPRNFATDDAVLSANVSPDGRWLSYVEGDTLIVVDLRTGLNKLTRPQVDGMGVEPVWSPDSKRLIIAVNPGSNQRIGTLNLDNGSFTAFPFDLHGTHLRWSADGRSIGYADGAGAIYVMNADGSGKRKVPGLTDEKPPYSFDLESLSAGGAKIALWVNDGSTPAGDVARRLYANAVLDTRTGAKIRIPVSGQVLQVLLRADATMLVRVKGAQHNDLVLISAAGSVLTRTDEPTTLKDDLLLNA
jgi:TolB protein